MVENDDSDETTNNRMMISGAATKTDSLWLTLNFFMFYASDWFFKLTTSIEAIAYNVMSAVKEKALIRLAKQSLILGGLLEHLLYTLLSRE